MLHKTIIDRMASEGLSTVSFKIVEEKDRGLFVQLKIDVGNNWNEPDPQQWNGNSTKELRSLWMPKLSEFSIKKPHTERKKKSDFWS